MIYDRFLMQTGQLTPDQFLEETIQLGREEEAWAQRLGFDTAADYHRASDEAFEETYLVPEQSYLWGGE